MRASRRTDAFGPIREPLSYVLGTRGRVGSLRVLAVIHEPVTQREVARRARLQHRTVQLALDELVQLGVVSRLEGGRDFLVRLNRTHRLASPLQELFRIEAEHFLQLRSALTRLTMDGRKPKDVLSLVLYGSAARAEDRAASDLDVMLISEDAASLGSALSRLDAGKEQLRERFGVSLRPIGYTLTQARRLWRRRQTPLSEAQREGIPLVGPSLRELLSGEG
jgi:predicted nucleotidyltransferase